MKNLIAFGMLAMLATACVETSNDDDPTLGIIESELSTVWTPFTSDEYPPVTCPSGGLVQGIRCYGRYCDNIAMRCEVEAAPYIGPPYGWRPYISEESPNTMTCDSGEWMNGIKCRGRYCDDISIQCQHIATPLFHSGQGENCEWSPWISDEHLNGFSWTAGKYARGVQCRGRYCDDKRFLVCNP